MKANLLKLICVAFFTITATTVMAQQKGEMAAGINLAYGTGDSYSNFGIGAKFQWNVIDKLRLEPSFTYFLKKDYVSMWDLGVNVHYLFPISDKLVLYPLAGVGVLGSKYSATADLGEWGTYGGSSSDSEFGFNLGAGADLKLTDKLFLNVELKYKIGDVWNRFIASAGIGYKF